MCKRNDINILMNRHEQVIKAEIGRARGREKQCIIRNIIDTKFLKSGLDAILKTRKLT